jgi:uncharacterized membrane protein
MRDGHQILYDVAMTVAGMDRFKRRPGALFSAMDADSKRVVVAAVESGRGPAPWVLKLLCGA